MPYRLLPHTADLRAELEAPDAAGIYQAAVDEGILVRAASRATIDEEMPEAYRDVSTVVDVVHGAGIGRKVVMLKPMGVVKG